MASTVNVSEFSASIVQEVQLLVAKIFNYLRALVFRQKASLRNLVRR